MPRDTRQEFLNEKGNKKTSHRKAMLVFKMVPIIGFELMTYRLQGGCSTN